MSITADPPMSIDRIVTDTLSGITPQSAAIFILTHLTPATLVTLTHHLLAASHRSP